MNWAWSPGAARVSQKGARQDVNSQTKNNKGLHSYPARPTPNLYVRGNKAIDSSVSVATCPVSSIVKDVHRLTHGPFVLYCRTWSWLVHGQLAVIHI